MLNATGVAELAAHKRALVAQCEAHRRALGIELAQLQLSVTAVARPVESALSLSGLLMGGLPLLGLFLGPSRKGGRNWFKIGLFGFQLFRRLQPLWARFRLRRNQESS